MPWKQPFSAVFLLINLVLRVHSDNPQNETIDDWRAPSLDAADGLRSVNIALNDTTLNRNNATFWQKYRISAKNQVPIKIVNELDTAELYFYYLQVHSFMHPVAIRWEPNNTHNGTNLGRIFHLDSKQNVTVQLSNDNENVTISLLITLLVYERNGTAVPGGNDSAAAGSTLNITTSEDTITVDTAGAAEDSTQDNEVQYSFRYAYLDKNDFSEQSYFSAIDKFLRGADALSHGYDNGRENPQEPLRRIYSRNTGLGMFFVTVVRSPNSPLPVAYVPGHSYAFTRSSDAGPGSATVENVEAKVIYVLILLVGITQITCSRGLMFLRMIIYSFIIGGFIVFFIYTKVQQEMKASVIIWGGMVFAILWIYLWMRCNSQAWVIGMQAAIILGYIIACVILYFISDSQSFLLSSLNYHSLALAFTILVVFGYFVMSFCGRVVINALTGATFVVLTLIIMFDGNLQYALVNNWRRIRDEQFKYALYYPHLERADWICLSLWTVIVLTRIYFQKCCFGAQGSNQQRVRIFRDPTCEPLIVSGNNSHSSDNVFLTPRSNRIFMAIRQNRSINYNIFKFFLRSP